MMKINKFLVGTIGVILGATLGATSALAGVLYNDIPAADYNTGPETTSWGSTASTGDYAFGNVISLTGGQANVATVVLSNYATASQYFDSNPTYNAALTFNLWQVTDAGVNAALAGPGAASVQITDGSQLTSVASISQTSAINYRPEASLNPSETPSTLNCGGGNSPAYWDSTANQYSCGQLNFVNFNLGSLSLAAGNYMYAVEIDGGDPATASLNWALNNFVDASSISTASNPAYDVAYENYYPTTGWSNIGQGELSISGPSSGAPEPASLGLIGLGLVGLGAIVRKNRRNG